ncbi:putative polyketide synthase [Gordonia effusa NBRC 100432]|uniref:Putative polyketide synthase n=1 Tax=Gordonia effusa NBRC 100432 TaxID=1077974 RepID=H0R6L2_9ACTN|nr:type I polyketide synthase [Gordonia effusa]GAB20713.1 putative polyketide synthase [Gordonia effusa NBRC 100432]
MTTPTAEEKLRLYLKRVTQELQNTRQRLEQATAGQTEPIAITSMACRYPGGVRSPEDLWELVDGGVDAVGEFPGNRGWPADLHRSDPDTPGASLTGQGGFLYDADKFDAAFFNIGEREAIAVDPQQRVMLELSWELLERAKIVPSSLRGSATGVFTGVMYYDYGTQIAPGTAQDGYVVIGSAASVVSGRIAYSLGVTGPAISVDTACSSSLVAVDQAMSALRNGEIDLAIAGGVTVMSTPTTFVDFTKQRALSPDGRCRSFSAEANGTGWSEGAGLLLLERLSDAERNGHEIHGVLRSCAVNQDGRSSQLTAPHGPSQERVLRAALDQAGLSPEDINVIEAHGTGTSLGDPIEIGAIAAVFGQGRSTDDPLYIGSLKSNIGHSQAAAGVGGIIKMTMAIKNERLPRTLHSEKPSHHIDWESIPLRLLQEPRDWPSHETPRRAGISSFGISGTNAHVVLEEAPHETAPLAESVDDTSGPIHIWPLSGHDQAALRAQASKLLPHVTIDGEQRPADFARALATTRTTFRHRAAVTGRTIADLVVGLEAVATSQDHPGSHHGTPRDGALTFMFSGQGSQRPGAGVALLEYPVFRETFEKICHRIDDLMAGTADVSLRSVALDGATDDSGGAWIDHTLFTQPALFALEVATAELLESWGIRPDFVIGHSIGELAAAHVAGVLSRDDACRLVAARATAMDSAAQEGLMIAVGADSATVLARIGDAHGVDLAAENAPGSTVISGGADSVAAVADSLRADGYKTKILNTSHAFHSAHMDPIVDEFLSTATELEYRRPTIPIVSNLTGEFVDTAMDAAYWARHLRRPVRFADGIRTVHAAGTALLVEVGPGQVLTALAAETVGSATSATTSGGQPPVTISTLPIGPAADDAILAAVAELHVNGRSPEWTSILGEGTAADLPTYAFQRQRFWPATSYRTGPESTTDDGWNYHVEFHDIDAPAVERQPGHWLVIDHVGQMPRATAVAERLDRAGATTVTVEVNAEQIADSDSLATLVSSVTDHRSPAGIVSLLALGDGDRADNRPGAHDLYPTVALTRAMDLAGLQTRLWAVTSGAVTATRIDRTASPAQSLVWGFGSVAAVELPHVWAGVIDINDLSDTTSLDAATGVMTSRRNPETEIALRSGRVLARRLVREPAADVAPGWQPDPDGTILITGGLGALGIATARWLAAAGARHLVLVSRRGPETPGVDAVVDELGATGVATTVVACDISDRGQVQQVVDAISPDHPLTAVFHTAAALDDSAIGAIDADRVRAALEAKARGAVNLHDATTGIPLTAFVTYSSIAGLCGIPGQANYAPANAFLDALATYRSQRELPATSISWGLWDGDGIIDDAGAQRAALFGFRPMDPALAVESLGRVVGGARAHVAIADVDWKRLAERQHNALIAELGDFSTRIESAPGASWETVLTTDGDRMEAAILLISENVKAVQGAANSSEVDPDLSFSERGFDSITAVELRNRLRSVTGLPLSPAVLFDYPTPRAVAGHLLSVHGEDTLSPTAEVLGHIDQLETTLTDLDDSGLTEVRSRLRSLVAMLDDSRTSDFDTELSNTSDSELADFITKNLGIS